MLLFNGPVFMQFLLRSIDMEDESLPWHDHAAAAAAAAAAAEIYLDNEMAV
ncbi:MAG: hypothetical protein M3Z01_01700 [Thermoproteota archaeon]|nr:hypothetical protein [Thermoproteota archaeon]